MSRVTLWRYRLKAAWAVLCGRSVAYRMQIVSCADCQAEGFMGIDTKEPGIVVECNLINREPFHRPSQRLREIPIAMDQFQTSPGGKRK